MNKFEESQVEDKESLGTVTLEQPDLKYKDGYLAALAEFQAEGRYQNLNIEELESDFDAFIEKIPNIRIEMNKVPESEFWLIDNEEYIGRLSIRHELNEELLRVGGHIGYAIRPSERKRGYGKKALELGLQEAKKLGLKKVLVTCDSNNIGSRKIIESQGGVLENEVEGKTDEPTKLRFWIDIK